MSPYPREIRESLFKWAKHWPVSGWASIPQAPRVSGSATALTEIMWGGGLIDYLVPLGILQCRSLVRFSHLSDSLPQSCWGIIEWCGIKDLRVETCDCLKAGKLWPSSWPDDPEGTGFSREDLQVSGGGNSALFTESVEAFERDAIEALEQQKSATVASFYVDGMHAIGAQENDFIVQDTIDFPDDLQRLSPTGDPEEVIEAFERAIVENNGAGIDREHFREELIKAVLPEWMMQMRDLNKQEDSVTLQVADKAATDRESLDTDEAETVQNHDADGAAPVAPVKTPKVAHKSNLPCIDDEALPFCLRHCDVEQTLIRPGFRPVAISNPDQWSLMEAAMEAYPHAIAKTKLDQIFSGLSTTEKRNAKRNWRRALNVCINGPTGFNLEVRHWKLAEDHSAS